MTNNKIKIAIITPGELPIPSVLDGAIETLINLFINENEIIQKIDIVVYSHFNAVAEQQSFKYKNTTFNYIKTKTILAYLFNFYFRLIRKIKQSKELPINFFLKKCITSISKQNYDFVILEGGTFQVLTIKRHINNKIILHVHADILNKLTENAKEIYDSCYKIVTVSNFIKSRVAEISNEDAEKVVVLPNGIDISNFQYEKYKVKVGELRKVLEIGKHTKVILFCGRINEGKGIKELLLACKDICADYRLIVAGASWFSVNIENDYEKQIRRLAESMENKPIFLGYIPNIEMPLYYSLADICVCPSICNDAAPLVPLEALASGTPVISSNKGGLPEHVSVECGDLIDVDEDFVINLTKIISRYIEDKDYYLDKKKHTLESVLQFDKKNYYNNFVNILSNNND